MLREFPAQVWHAPNVPFALVQKYFRVPFNGLCRGPVRIPRILRRALVEDARAARPGRRAMKLVRLGRFLQRLVDQGGRLVLIEKVKNVKDAGFQGQDLQFNRFAIGILHVI
jgi:hypothetical protein